MHVCQAGGQFGFFAGFTCRAMIFLKPAINKRIFFIHCRGKIQVMGDHNHTEVQRSAEFMQQGKNSVAATHIKISGGFIGQQQQRL